MIQAGGNINSRGTPYFLAARVEKRSMVLSWVRDAAVDKMVMPDALGYCPEPGHRRGLESLVNFYSHNLLIRRCFPTERTMERV